MSGHTTTCLHCLEPIRPGASRCPACTSWQSKWGADSQNLRLELMAVGGGLLALAILATVWLMASPEKTKAVPGDLIPQLSITDASAAPADVGDRRTLAVRATVHSRADHKITNLYVVVRLRDQSGELLEEFSGRDSSIVVPPGDSAPLVVVNWWPTTDPDLIHEVEIEVRRAQGVD